MTFKHRRSVEDTLDIDIGGDGSAEITIQSDRHLMTFPLSDADAVRVIGELGACISSRALRKAIALLRLMESGDSPPKADPSSSTEKGSERALEPPGLTKPGD